MRVLHLSWEYPPVMYGGLGRHVHALANAQATNGHDVVVITQTPPPGGPDPEDPAGGAAPADPGPVRVLRAGGDPVGHDLLGNVATMERAFTACGEDLLTAWVPEAVHAHDWMVSHAAVSLRAASGSPLVATIHATEAGRNRGWVSTPLSTTIHALEWWLANTADAVITCSRAMDAEVRTLFGIGPTVVIANGVDRSHWVVDGGVQRVRAEHAEAGPLLAYSGRVEWEKGVQTILEALPALRRAHPGVRLLVVGRGSYLPSLQARARDLGVGDATRFLGWVSEEQLRAVVAAADVAIAPSLYEPFGLVALEAAALGTPVVVSDTGGLAEFAAGGERARTFRPGDPASLADAVERDLADPPVARQRARRAREALAVQHDWRVLAEQTVDAYRQARAALGTSDADPRRDLARARHALEPPRFGSPPGHLLDVGL